MPETVTCSAFMYGNATNGADAGARAQAGPVDWAAANSSSAKQKVRMFTSYPAQFKADTQCGLPGSRSLNPGQRNADVCAMFAISHALQARSGGLA
jgi:hypothetical protein